MNYLVCHVWPSTKGNHAGMSHMCDLLKSSFANEYEVIKVNHLDKIDRNKFPLLKNKLLNSLFNFIHKSANLGVSLKGRIYYKMKYSKLAKDLVEKLQDGDSVFLLEYLMPLCFQDEVAKIIKRNKPNVTVVALSHLTPSKMKQTFPNMNVAKWAAKVDYMTTLGDSLSNYINEEGVSKEKVKTLFHYVDLDYYTPKIKPKNERLNVIMMGSLQRDYDQLRQIIETLPNVLFTICKGRRHLPQFESFENVRLLGYLSEDELKSEMNKADVSLNVMEDTIGSNVITTSMAMGLAMIVSDVGSIRNYCDSSNAFFCNTQDDFIQAISDLDKDRHNLYSMQEAALTRSKEFSIEMFHEKYKSIL